MQKIISAAEANRRFSELLRTVKAGRSVAVTSHGKPVARMVPVVEDEALATQRVRDTISSPASEVNGR
jgi:prevent-host-death family protein